jgi:hydroxyethylthiazole kinase-like sugar kinase family protein
MAEVKNASLIWSSLSLFKLGQVVYPIMLTQEAGEISESRAAELLGLNIETYRQKKQETVKAIVEMATSLPSPLILLLEGTKEKPKS